MIYWKKIKSSRRVDLPSFAPIFDDMDLSEMNYLPFYLKGLVNFENRDQAKRDFLDLAKSLNGNNSDIREFEGMYNQYNMHEIPQERVSCINWSITASG